MEMAGNFRLKLEKIGAGLRKLLILESSLTEAFKALLQGVLWRVLVLCLSRAVIGGKPGQCSGESLGHLSGPFLENTRLAIA